MMTTKSPLTEGKTRNVQKGNKSISGPNVRPTAPPPPPAPPPKRTFKEIFLVGLVETEGSKQRIRDWDAKRPDGDGREGF